MKKLVVLAMTTLMLASALASSTRAQEWPQKPIRIIVSFGPGGGADIIGRILAEFDANSVGQAGGGREQARRRRHHRQ